MSDAARFFDAIASRYDREYALPSPDSRRRFGRLTQELPPPPASILDLGVGTGRELPALLDAGYAPTGVDVSQAMLDRCARRARPIPLVLADFWAAPLRFEPRSFDAAIALHGTLAHPPDAGALARLGHELARIVRPGGSFVAEVPAPAWLDAVAAQPPAPGSDRALRRTGPRTCIFEDRTARASIEARILDADEWRQALGGDWIVRVEPLEALEWIVVGRRA